ncbi:acetylcholine receptor subunit alpha [Harmonia axyridis]|uniref:acetylcholine receptor subunit alpha n=1 Tax=Harmonia axyridis TaxID=115357 RepID=UPI001E276670|nr:acetylcholine receptor subunit alpha [Harmonia axyridis]
MLLSVIISVLYIQSCYGKFNPTNETDLSRCKVYYSRSGTTYTTFFELQKPNRNETDLRLDFHFSVLAASDAHILIATTKKPAKNDPAYEIVIGAGGNTFCDIRRMQKNQVKESVRIKGLLSALDPRSFWIHITRNGVIEVGKEGEELAFISWKDYDPLPITTIGFSTWPGIEAKWYFDCIRDDIKKIKRNLTNEERLRRDLLNHYDPMVIPTKNESMKTMIKMAPEIRGLSLDEKRSMLHTQGVAHVMWMDEKLVWNASAYGNVSEIRVSSIEMWKPNLIVYNHFEDDEYIFDNTQLVVKSNGLVYWHPRLDLRTWCDVADSEHNRWPKDRRSCDIIFTFATDLQKLWIKYTNLSDTQKQNPKFADWIVEEIDIYTALDPELKTDKEYLYVTVELRRNSEIYSRVFLTTYIVTIISILCSFCVSPSGPYKMSLGCFQLVLSISCLIFIGILLPAHDAIVPYIVRLHSYSVTAGVFSIIIAIIVINLSRLERQKQLPNILTNLLTSTIFRRIFCLPEIERDQYGRPSSITRMKFNQQHYILLGVLIDRICLFIGICLFVYSVSLY